MKICNKCKIKKDFIYFSRDSSRIDGLACKCKECFKHPKKLKIIDNHKVCIGCNKNKNLKDYYRNNGNSLGYDPICKICKIEYRKIKGLNKWNPKYNGCNKEYKKIYFENNKEKIYKRIKIWKNKNPSIKLGYILRTQIGNYIRKGKAKKHTSTTNILSCNVQELKVYLEKSFLIEMTWENWGKIWEIDHILPCSSFDLTKLEEQKKCFHYTNLQPLFKTTDIAKSFGYNNIVGNREKGNKTI